MQLKPQSLRSTKSRFNNYILPFFKDYKVNKIDNKTYLEWKDYILNKYKKIELKYDKEKYLENYFEEEFTEEKINSYVKEYVDLIDSHRKNISKLLIDLNDYFDGDYVTAVEDQLNKLMNATTYEEIYNSLDFKSIKAVPSNTSCW